jgi:SAM-dependent methyltransferase
MMSILTALLRPIARVLPLDAALLWSQKLGSICAKLVFFRDWRLQVRGWPQFYKHDLNLALWRFEPARWSFAARGVFARARMFKGCKVLDLCCGDGFHTHLSFSDIAGHIDAVDLDGSAMAYARKYHRAPAIAYHLMDIVRDDFPATAYDVIVWNAAICYFDAASIRRVLRKIVNAGTSAAVLAGMLPKASGYVDHKTEFASAHAVQELLLEYFERVSVREIVEMSGSSFYFEAEASRREAEPVEVRVEEIEQ